MRPVSFKLILHHLRSSEREIQVRDVLSAGARESTVRSERRPARYPCSYATVFDELCSAQADGVESEKGASICGASDLGTTDTPGLPYGLQTQLTLLFEFEARNGFKTDILKYIKICFAGGRVPTISTRPLRTWVF